MEEVAPHAGAALGGGGCGRWAAFWHLEALLANKNVYERERMFGGWNAGCLRLKVARLQASLASVG